MNYRSYMAISLMLIGVMGCSIKEKAIEEVVDPRTEQGSEQNGDFKIVFEADPFVNGDLEDTDTKTSVVPNENYTRYGFVWSQKDTVGIYPDSGNQVFFNMTNGAGATTAEFDGGAWSCKEGHEFRSYFPFYGDIYLDATKIPVTFTGQKQVGNENSDHFQKYDYMYTPAVSKGEGNLVFSYHHLVTVIFPWVELPAGHYTCMTLSLDEPLFVTNGRYDLTASSPTIVGTESSNTLHVELDVTFSSPDILKVFIPLAPLDMTGKTLTITVTDEDGRPYVFTKNPSRAYEAGNIYRLQAATSLVNTNIAFADPAVKAICVNLWDTDSDGELSYAEAAAVTTINAGKSAGPDVFTYNTSIQSFDEFRYFTGCTTIGYKSQGSGDDKEYYGAFEGCTSLTSITLPSSLTTIGFSAFDDCTSLESIVIPASVSTICGYAFSGSYKLKMHFAASSPTSITFVQDPHDTAAYAFGPEFDFGLLSYKVRAIYVPTEDAVAACKSASEWSMYSDRIFLEGTPYPDITVSLNKSSVNIESGKTSTVKAYVSPSFATDKRVTFTSSDPSIVSLTQNKNSNTATLTGNSVGTAVITATAVDGGATVTCEVTVREAGVIVIPDAVDLGLSVKWASFNLGAATPVEYGYYYSWGETDPKVSYTNVAYTVSGYNSTDHKTVLEPSDDVACVKLGDKWRMPTKAEFEELVSGCTFEYVYRDDISGYLITSKTTSGSIFLPSAGCYYNNTFSSGYARYWSSTLSDYSTSDAYIFISWGEDMIETFRRYDGLPVRPVYDENDSRFGPPGSAAGGTNGLEIEIDN